MIPDSFCGYWITFGGICELHRYQLTKHDLLHILYSPLCNNFWDSLEIDK